MPALLRMAAAKDQTEKQLIGLDYLKEEVQIKQMIIEGLIAIQNGENPHFIEQRLRSYIQEEEKPEKGEKAE